MTSYPRSRATATKKQMVEFGAEIRRRRELLGLDQREFAKAVGISYKHFFNIEAGVAWTGLTPYIAICRALNVKEIPLVDGVKK